MIRTSEAVPRAGEPRATPRSTRVVVRKVEPWSVLKFSLLFYLCLFVTLLSAGVLLWAAASSAGAIDDIEEFIKDLFAFETFQFEPALILQS